MNAAFPSPYPTIIPTRKHTFPTGEIMRISHGVKTTMIILSNFSNHFQIFNYQQNFSDQVSHYSFQNPQAEKKQNDLEKSMKNLI